MDALRRRIRQHLAVLVDDIGARPPGSPANRRASTYVSDVLVDCGLDVVEHPFTTRWWDPGAGSLQLPDGTVEVLPDPYSPPVDVRAPTVHADHVARLEALEELSDAVLVLEGELAREQLMPAAFPFLDLPEHDRVRAALARLAPRAVISVSDHWEPILEDPDLALPSTTVPSAVGARLRPGTPVRLVLGGAVRPGSGANVSARTGGGDGRIVLSAHLDSKATTPGAFDNAAGVAAVLAVAQAGPDELADCEIVLFNGEDHFDAAGEVAWLAATDLGAVAANVNVDGIGLAGHGTSVAALACPDAVETALASWVDQRTGWTQAAPWFQSDHAIFAMQGIPAVAVTTRDVQQLLGGLAHTAADTREVLDLAVVEDVARALPELLALLCEQLGRSP